MSRLCEATWLDLLCGLCKALCFSLFLGLFLVLKLNLCSFTLFLMYMLGSPFESLLVAAGSSVIIVYDVLHHVCVCTWKVTGFINLAPAKYCVNNDNCDHYIEFVEYRPTNLKYDGATTIRSKLLCYRHGV